MHRWIETSTRASNQNKTRLLVSTLHCLHDVRSALCKPCLLRDVPMAFSALQEDWKHCTCTSIQGLPEAASSAVPGHRRELRGSHHSRGRSMGARTGGCGCTLSCIYLTAAPLDEINLTYSLPGLAASFQA